MKEQAKKPQVSSRFAQKELDKAEAQFDKFNEGVKNLTLDRMNEAPVEQREPQVKMSTREAQKSDGMWLKPSRTIRSKESFNEKFRKDYEHASERVKFTAENKDLIGIIEMWTKPFPGVDAEYWEFPANRVVWGPRYLAAQIKRCRYHRLSMEPDQTKITGSDIQGTYFGVLAVENTVQRLDAHPVSDSKSFFAGNF